MIKQVVRRLHTRFIAAQTDEIRAVPLVFCQHYANKGFFQQTIQPHFASQGFESSIITQEIEDGDIEKHISDLRKAIAADHFFPPVIFAHSLATILIPYYLESFSAKAVVFVDPPGEKQLTQFKPLADYVIKSPTKLEASSLTKLPILCVSSDSEVLNKFERRFACDVIKMGLVDQTVVAHSIHKWLNKFNF